MKKVVLIALAIFVVDAAARFFMPSLSRREANQAIIRIEDFRRANHRLPKSLSEIGIKESDQCLCYQVEDQQNYAVWYQKPFTLGESITYDSKSRKWSD